MDDIKVNQNPKLGSMDRPNSYIGRSLPRENAKKHLEGGGQFVDDLVLPRMLHVAFLRSPLIHASIKGTPVRPSIHADNFTSSLSRRLSYMGIKFSSSIEGSSSSFCIKCERQ